MKYSSSRWLSLLLLIGFNNFMLADEIQDQIARLEDQHAGVRGSAANALGELGDARAVEPLIACLKDQDWGVRVSITEALGKLGDARAVEPLIACMKDNNAKVRYGASVALGKLGDARATEPLITYIASLDGKSQEDFIRRSDAANALVKLGKSAVEPLIPFLKDRNVDVRRGAAEALGKLGDARAVDPLIACLKDRNVSMRRIAATALGNLGDERAVDPLIACLNDKDDSVRNLVAHALGELGDERAAKPLIACLKHKHQDYQDSVVLQRIVAEALGKLGPLIHGEGGEKEGEAGTAFLTIDSSGSPPDTLLVFNFNGYKIQNGGTAETPIRRRLASGEQQSISIRARSHYRLPSSSAARYDVKTDWIDLSEMRWVPVKGKKYTLKIAISLTIPKNVTGRDGDAVRYFSRGPAGTIRAKLIQDDDDHLVVQKEGTMYY